MGEKSEQKKQFIVVTARQVFMEKGYKNVTMKDIVEACEISRGGLYLYFDSTESLFREVLDAEEREADDVFSQEIPKDATPADILLIFLKEQKKEILNRKGNLSAAVYEYYFGLEDESRDSYLRSRFEKGARILQGLIEIGTLNGEMSCEDPAGAARNIMFVLEGLKICVQTMGLSESIVDRELRYITQGLDMA